MVGREWFYESTQEPQSAQDLHVIHVYNDPDFQADIKNIGKDSATKDEDMAALSRKYFVSVNDVQLYFNGLLTSNSVRRQVRPFDLRPDGKGHWLAWISGDISKEDYMNMWADLKRIKARKNNGKLPKNKPPKYDDLLYAVFKARQDGDTFPTIFKNTLTRHYLTTMGRMTSSYSTTLLAIN